VAAVARMLRDPRGGVARDLLRRGLKVEAAAKLKCPVDHGRLRSSIHAALVITERGLVCEVGTDVKYAMWVHDGTGLYGPRHARIYPKNARVLVFTPRVSAPGGPLIARKNRKTVFVRSTRGMRGTPFLRDALPAMFG
jgi:hypothetical protein